MKLVKVMVLTGMLLICVNGNIQVAADEPNKVIIPRRPRVEVVFVLDTTGSMSGLINAAKEKIWAIANTLATAKPAPQIKMGLVGYRDRGDQYITKQCQLTDDLDMVYRELMAFKADGGGDGPESVNQALHEAVTQMAWSKDKGTYRVIFLVGDYPPHMDYQDDVKYPQSCKQAAEAGIVINTIQCGNFKLTEPIWSEIARKAEGRYFKVEQSGGAILASTPFDAELGDLSEKLDATRIYYGSSEIIALQLDRDKAADEIYAYSTESAKARRAVFNAGKAGERNFLGIQELVSDVKEGRVQLEKIEEKQLPEEILKLPVKERDKYIEAKAVQRKEIQKQITELASKRQKYLEEQAKKHLGKQTLDHGIFDCIQEQAAQRGIEYEGGPSL